jgi:hypothetical protein
MAKWRLAILFDDNEDVDGEWVADEILENYSYLHPAITLEKVED